MPFLRFYCNHFLIASFLESATDRIAVLFTNVATVVLVYSTKMSPLTKYPVDDCFSSTSALHFSTR